MPIETARMLHVTSRAAWRAWLERHHEDETEVWLVFFKARAEVHAEEGGEHVVAVEPETGGEARPRESNDSCRDGDGHIPDLGDSRGGT